MRYRASFGGHSPDYLRDAFLYWLEANEERDFVIVGYDEERKPIRWLIGQLWNCTDIMPSEYCDILDLPCGSTYATGVREIAK